MASSVAKLKPLQSVTTEPDEAFRENMEENEVLAGLARTADSDRKAEILSRLRADARRNGGRLKFEDRHRLFHVLQSVLSDSNWNARLQCLEFLSETIPGFGEDLDACMSLLLPQIVSNLGNNQVLVKKSAIQTLHVYMPVSKEIGNIFSTIIEHGLESEDRRTRNESLIAMPILITPNLAQEDLFTVTQALVGRLETSSKPESSPAIISLERIKNAVGNSKFEGYVRRLTQSQQQVYSAAIQNRTTDSGRDIEGYMARKAKSAGHLSTNGVMELERRLGRTDGENSLDRGHTITVNYARDGFTRNEGNLEFGFVPRSVAVKLRDQTNWRIRAQGIEELKTLMGQITNISSILPYLGALFGLLLDFLDDVNFKITVTSLQIIELLVGKLELSVKPFLKPLVGALTNKLGDNKIVIRQENMKVLMHLMHILSPAPILKVLTSSLQHRNSRVREEALNVVIAALLTFPSSDFDLPELTRAIAPALVDSKRRVRQAALEAFAVISQAMGPGRLQPVVSAVDAVELTMGGDGVMAAIQARLARRQLPRMNSDGLVEYAVPCPSSGTTRGKNNTPRGADVEWVLAGTTGSDSSSARSTPGLNDSLNSSGPSPRRYFSAGKHRLPWEGDSSQGDNGTDKPPPTKNSWVPTELINDGKRGSAARQRAANLSSTLPSSAPSSSSSKPSSSSYADKYLAKSLHNSSPSGSQEISPPSPMNSYAEIHRRKKEKKLAGYGGTSQSPSASFSGAGAGGSYALLYKRGTIHSKAKATSSAEPELSPKEPVVRGTQSATPTGYQHHPPTSDDEYTMMKKSYTIANPLSSSWPEWTEPTSPGRPFGRLSPVSHTVSIDMDCTSDGDADFRKGDSRDVQTPVHIKPQLVRSASKVRGMRAPELELDLLESSLNNRPAPLAPVGQGKTGSPAATVPPPKDALRQVHKQAATKRALKMYSVFSDSDDGRSRTPSPLEPIEPQSQLAAVEESVRSSRIVLGESSPFDCRPRIARTPAQNQRPSDESSLSPQRQLDPLSLSLGVTGYGILADRGHARQNGSAADQQSYSSGIGSSVNGSADMKNVEVVGQGLFRDEATEGTQGEGSGEFEYETEESEDDDEEEEEEDEDEDEDEETEEEEDELETSHDKQGIYSIDQESQHEKLKDVKDMDSFIPTDDSGESSESEEEDTAESRSDRDMTPRTMRKSLSKSTRERMERRRQEEEDKLLKEQQRLEELEKDRMKQIRQQQEDEKKLKSKIMKEQHELEKMLQRKEKERELEKQKQKQLQQQLQQQEKALKEKLQKQTEELEVLEQEKQWEKEREKERLKEKARQRQLKLQQETELRKQLEEEEEEERKRADEDDLRQQQLKKEVERKRKELEKQRMAAVKDVQEVKDLTVTGSSTPLSPVKLSTNKPPSGNSPRKKIHTTSPHSEREAGYAVTDESSEGRNQYASSSHAGVGQCWEVSLSDLQPFGNPEQAFRDVFKCFGGSTEDWEVRCEGLQYIRRLCKHHPEVVISQLHAVVLAVLKEVKNLRSQVSRAAICSLCDMFTCLGKNMDVELETVAKILLPKAGESSGFIRDDVERALSAMVQSSSGTRCLGALITGGASNRNVAVRKTTAQFLSVLAERMGPNRLLSGAKDVTERILPCLAKLAVGGGPENRYYARKILYLIYEHPDFDKQLTKYVNGSDLKSTRDICEQLRAKGLGDPPNDPSSARQRKNLPGSGFDPRTGSGSSGKSHLRSSTDPSLRASFSPGSSRESSRSGKTPSRENLRIQGEENIPDLIKSLGANEWKERLQAIDQLVNLVRMNPEGLGPKFTKVFDVYIPRLQDSNSKVNLHALHSLVRILPALATQSGALVAPLVSAVTVNLASKNINIYNAASEALKELIKHIDNTFLIQPFSAASQYGNTRVRPVMIEKLADIVPVVYARKPQVISRHVLPVMWALLESTGTASAGGGNPNVKSGAVKLTRVLYSCMGRSLLEQSSTQKPRVQQRLQEFVEVEPS